MRALEEESARLKANAEQEAERIKAEEDEIMQQKQKLEEALARVQAHSFRSVLSSTSPRTKESITTTPISGVVAAAPSFASASASRVPGGAVRDLSSAGSSYAGLFSLFPARSLAHFSHSRIACARVPSYVCGLYDLYACMCMRAYDDARMLLYLVQGQRPRPEQQRAVKNLQVRLCMVRTGLKIPLLRLQRPQFQQEERAEATVLPTRRKDRGNSRKDSPD